MQNVFEVASIGQIQYFERICVLDHFISNIEEKNESLVLIEALKGVDMLLEVGENIKKLHGLEDNPILKDGSSLYVALEGLVIGKSNMEVQELAESILNKFFDEDWNQEI